MPDATLTRIEQLTPDVFLYTLETASPILFRAGQFVNLAVPGAAPRGERSYSVWSDPADPDLQLCVKLFPGGAASEFLRARSVGDVLQLTGPFGVFTLPPANAPSDGAAGPITMVATATGLAPFHAMLCEAARTGDARSFEVLLGVRTEADVFAVDRLEALATRLDLRHTVFLSRPEPGWTGFRGRVTELLRERAPHEGVYLLCGNGAMVTEARADLKARGVDRKRIRYEKYY